MNADVSVIVVNWNGGDDLLACAASVYAQSGVAIEFVVVDNASSDDSLARLIDRHPSVRIIETGENLGFAEGCNHGLAVTEAPWVLLLNSDAALDPDALARLLREAQSADPSVAALQPTLLFLASPDRINSTGINLFADGTAIDRSFGKPLTATLDPPAVFGVTAGAALLRRSALEDIRLSSGIFDRGFFMYLEDVDLAWRLRLAGYSARYVSAATVRHRYQGSSQRHGADFVGRHCRENRLPMLVKNASKRMLVRGLARTSLDLLRIAHRDGLPGLTRVAGACRAAVNDRREIRRLLRVSRRRVERDWARHR